MVSYFLWSLAQRRLLLCSPQKTATFHLLRVLATSYHWDSGTLSPWDGHVSELLWRSYWREEVWGLLAQWSCCLWTAWGAPRALNIQISIPMQCQVFHRLAHFSVVAPALSGIFLTILDFFCGLLSSSVWVAAADGKGAWEISQWTCPWEKALGVLCSYTTFGHDTFGAVTNPQRKNSDSGANSFFSTGTGSWLGLRAVPLLRDTQTHSDFSWAVWTFTARQNEGQDLAKSLAVNLSGYQRSPCRSPHYMLDDSGVFFVCCCDICWTNIARMTCMHTGCS